MSLLHKKRYVPNVRTLHAMCDSNYVRLLKLLPDCDTENMQYEFGVRDVLRYKIEIIECARYTTTVKMSQVSAGLPDFVKPNMHIRLYHDAKMAEVIQVQNVGQIKAKYEYPNAQMHQPNEKEAINLFLAEWLAFCLANRNLAPELESM